MVRFFKGFCYSCVATIRKPDVFVYISNGFWQNDRRLSIKIWTICKTTSYYLLKSRRRDLRSPLYLTFFVRNSDSGLNLSSFRLHIEVHDPNIGLVHYSDCECICYQGARYSDPTFKLSFLVMYNLLALLISSVNFAIGKD